MQAVCRPGYHSFVADSQAETRTASEFPVVPMAKLPAKLGPVRLIRELGRGGMGAVWLGHHQLLDREVAVKFLLHIAPTENDTTFEALLRGARAAAEIHHPGVNQVFHADVIDGVPFLVLELINGRDLAEIVSERGPVDSEVARAVMYEICDATAQLHDLDLIHRDIKPANVMVADDGRCVLTDFGLATANLGKSFGATMGTRAGTVPYMSLEMFDGVASSRSDVYALGATAFHLLCGHPPFRGETAEVIRLKRDRLLEVGELHARNVPRSVIDVIERAMNPSVLYRPKTARHLLDAFETAWENAGTKRADRARVGGLLQADLSRATTNISPETASTYYEQLSTIAAKRQEDAAKETKEVERPRSLDQPVDSQILAKLAIERKQVQRATVAAIAVGGALTMLIGLSLAGGVTRLSVWFETDKRTRAAAPIWSEPLMYVAIVLAAAVAMLVALRVFQMLTPRRVRQLVSVHCGNCGYERKGVTDPRCSECGHLVGSTNAAGFAKAGSRTRLWLECALIPGLFAVAAMLFDTFILPMRSIGNTDQPVGLVLLIATMAAIGVAVSVKVFDRAEQAWFRSCGASWCAACGTELRDVRDGKCALCARPI
jgi:serine/threonine-protein kinase